MRRFRLGRVPVAGRQVDLPLVAERLLADRRQVGHLPGNQAPAGRAAEEQGAGISRR